METRCKSLKAKNYNCNFYEYKKRSDPHLRRARSVLTCAGAGARRDDGTPAPRLLLPALNNDDDDDGLMVSVDFHESVLDVVAVLLRTEESFRVMVLGIARRRRPGAVCISATRRPWRRDFGEDVLCVCLCI